jgi:hypothetical protein
METGDTVLLMVSKEDILSQSFQLIELWQLATKAPQNGPRQSGHGRDVCCGVHPPSCTRIGGAPQNKSNGGNITDAYQTKQPT